MLDVSTILWGKNNGFVVKRPFRVYYEKEKMDEGNRDGGTSSEGRKERNGGRRLGGINRRKKLRVSDIVDKSRPVGVSRRLTENFVVAGVRGTPREHFSLIRWEVPSVRFIGRLPVQFVGSWSANSRFILKSTRNFDNDYSPLVFVATAFLPLLFLAPSDARHRFANSRLI